METSRHVFNIKILAAWSLSAKKGTLKAGVSSTNFYELGPATVRIEQDASHNELSCELARTLLGPKYHHLVSAEVRKGRKEQIGITWTQGKTDVPTTTRLLITDGLDCDIIMKLEDIERLHSQPAIPYTPQTELISWLNPTENLVSPLLESQNLVKLTPSNLRDYQQMNSSIFSGVRSPIFHSKRTLSYEESQRPVQVQHPRVSHWVAGDRESCISSLTSECFSKKFYSGSLPSSDQMTTSEPRGGSPSSEDTLWTEAMQDKNDSLSLPELPYRKPWHHGLTIRDSSVKSFDMPESRDCDNRCFQRGHELEHGRTDKKLDQVVVGPNAKDDTVQVLQSKSLESFEEHPGHNYWEWDQQAQRWHKKGRSYDSETDWFPKEFA